MDANVALRKESVDRNISREMSLIRPYASLSARRAWIEMPGPHPHRAGNSRRSPQGERG